MNQQFHRGYGSIQELKTVLSEHHPQKIFLVTGKASYASCGAKGAIEPLFQNSKFCRFCDFDVNPKLEDIERGLRIFRNERCDCVIGVGGRTAIDIAKAIAILHSQDDEAKNIIEKNGIRIKRRIPLAVIPTTAGTGSESTHFSVVYITKTKYSLAHPSMLPDYVILDPTFALSCPPYISACCGMDALCQGIESYWSVKSTEESRRYSRKAIELVFSSLSESVLHPDKKNREKMLMGSNFAGRAINIAKTTAAHALSYPLTSYFNIPHGHAVGLSIGNFFILNANVDASTIQDARGVEFVKQRVQELVGMLHAKTPQEAANTLSSLMREIGLATSLSALGITEANVPVIAEMGFDQERVRNNPRKIVTENVKSILQEIF